MKGLKQKQQRLEWGRIAMCQVEAPVPRGGAARWIGEAEGTPWVGMLWGSAGRVVSVGFCNLVLGEQGQMPGSVNTDLRPSLGL